MPDRRTILQAAGIASLVHGAFGLTAVGRETRNFAQPASPVAGALSAEDLAARLRDAPVTSPLFPRDTGEIVAIAWVDDSDDDLAGTVGAVHLQDAAKGETDDAMLAALIVHPTAAAAEARLHEQADGDFTSPITLLGLPGVHVQSEDGYSLLGVADGNVIISAIGLPATERGPEETTVTSDFAATDFLALANMAGALDHLRLVRDGG